MQEHLPINKESIIRGGEGDNCALLSPHAPASQASQGRSRLRRRTAHHPALGTFMAATATKAVNYVAASQARA